MDGKTRAHALEKLDKMVDKIGYPGMHTAGEGGEQGGGGGGEGAAGRRMDSRVRSDLQLLQRVEDLYHRAEAHGTAGEGSAGRHVKSRVELAAVDADQLGPLALPLRLPARLRSPKALAKAKAAAVSLAAAEGEDEEQPRKHYSQQQMQMGGFPPEAWERPALNGNDAQGANGGNGGGNGKGGGNGQRQQPSGPFRIDNELNILPHETPDPPELFAHFYGYFGKSMVSPHLAPHRMLSFRLTRTLTPIPDLNHESQLNPNPNPNPRPRPTLTSAGR